MDQVAHANANHTKVEHCEGLVCVNTETTRAMAVTRNSMQRSESYRSLWVNILYFLVSIYWISTLKRGAHHVRSGV